MALLLPTSIFAASFNCESTSLDEIEKTICSNSEVSQLDEIMANLYKSLKSTHDNAGHLYSDQSFDSISKSQRDWIKIRNSCASTDCLKSKYLERTYELSSYLKKATYTTSIPFLENIIKKALGIEYVGELGENTVITSGVCNNSQCDHKYSLLLQFNGRDYPPTGKGVCGGTLNNYIAYIELDIKFDIISKKYLYNFACGGEQGFIYVKPDYSLDSFTYNYTAGYYLSGKFHPAFIVEKDSKGSLTYHRISDISAGEMGGNSHLY